MPGPPLIATGQLLCSFGLAPSSLMVLPVHRVTVEGRPVANVTDAVPMVNILPFGMCQSLANPTVAAATAAALGVLTPMPCVPVTEAWTPGSPQALIDGAPVVTMGSVCPCAYGGVIQIVNPGSTRESVG
ncbi:MAG: DUF4280 domain-containing protein [Mycobacteriales bacterium]